MSLHVRLAIGRLVLSTQPLGSLFKSCRRSKAPILSIELGRKRMSSSTNLFSTDRHSQQEENKKMTVCIEGNIGSGKTMLLEHFSSHGGDVQVIPEPVNAWRNVKGHNMLGLLYDDPVRWSFAFQSYVQLTMLTSHQIPHTHPYKMMERSIFSAKYCFVENLHRSGVMSDAEYAVLTEWFNWIITTSYVNVDQIVYLRTTPDQCYERIQKRHRREETGISMDYLTKLHELYEDWLFHRNSFPLPAPVVVINANNSTEQMLQYYKENKGNILNTDTCLMQR